MKVPRVRSSKWLGQATAALVVRKAEKSSPQDYAAVVSAAGRAVRLTAARKRPSGKRYDSTPKPCVCGHAKSIHARMYSNKNLGTACNFPECKCKGYKSR